MHADGAVAGGAWDGETVDGGACDNGTEARGTFNSFPVAGGVGSIFH